MIEPDEHIAAEFHLIVELASVMSDQQQRSLHDALNTYMSPNPARERRQLLAGVVTFMVMHDGMCPTAGQYRAFHAERRAAGLPGGSVAAITADFVSWAKGLVSALRIYRREHEAAAVSTHQAGGHSGPWTHAEIVEAVLDCRALLGTWPAAKDFVLIRNTSGEVLSPRRTGPLLLPSDPVIKKLFGGYGDMINEAKRLAAARVSQPQQPVTGPREPQSPTGTMADPRDAAPARTAPAQRRQPRPRRRHPSITVVPH